MKKPKQMIKNKLVATFAIFIAVIMLISSVPAMDVSNSDGKIEFKNVDIAPFDTSPGSIVSSPTMVDELSFYDPATVNASALGLTGTHPFVNWGTAIRLTPSELGPYTGGNLTGARFFHRFTDVNLSGPYTTGHSGNLTIFDEGTASTPGAILAQEPWFSSASEWVNVSLTTPLPISGTSDMWIHFEITSWAGEHPMGLDGGPALQGKGDMAKLPSGTWLSLGGAGIDRNNCIGAFAEGGTGDINDIAMISIDAPSYGEAGIITPQVTIENLGTTTPTDVPVSMQISTIGASTVLLTEDFEGFVPPTVVFPPTGWNIYNNGDEEWIYYTSGVHSGVGCARCTYDYPSPNDDWLTTKGSVVAPGLNFSVWIDGYSYGDDSFEIWMSTTGNTDTDLLAGTQLANVTTSPLVWTLYEYDMSAYIGQTVYFGLRYTGDYAWYLWADDFTFPDGTTEGFEPVPATGFPPAGWLLFDWDGTGTDFTANDDSLYAPPDSVGYFAYVKDTSVSDISETLLSPSVDMSGVSTARIQFDHKFDFWGPGDYAAVEIWSGGSYVEEIVQWTADADEHADIIFDPSSYSDPSDMRIGFYYYDGATYAEEWAIDNVEISAVPVLIEYDETVYVDIEADIRMAAPQTVEFPAWIPDDWQVTSNVILEYQVIASVDLDGDVNPGNNGIGPIAVDLIYPFTNDLGITEINSPSDAPPGQTFPVEITVENEGQFQATGFTANVEISAVDAGVGFFDFETNDGGFVPSADWDPVGDWEYTDSYDVGLYVPYGTHNFPPPTAYSGDGMWGTVIYHPHTNSGGTSFLKKTVDFSGVTDAYLSFYSWCDLWGSWDYGEVTVDGTQMFYIDTYNPTAWEFFTVDLSAYDGEEVEISFNLYATTVVNYTGWYIDDISYSSTATGTPPVLEYSETVTVTEAIDPDETIVVSFPDWTPAALLAGISCVQNYQINATIDYNPDVNEANDHKLNGLALEFTHDVTVKDITEPAIQSDRTDFIGYDDGTTENAYAWVDDSDWQEAIQLTDVELAPYRDYDITEVKFSCGSDLYGFYVADYEIWISDQLEDPTAPPVVYKTGTSSGTGWDTVTLDMSYDIPSTGDVYLGISYSNYGVNFPAGIDDSTYIPRGVWLYSAGWVDGTSIGLPPCVWGLDAGLNAGGGPGNADVYITPGSQSFAAITENLGTFPELGLTANAKLNAFNETGVPYLIYEENYSDFDLDVGEEETATFGSYTFVDNEIYNLVIFLPLSTDDVPANNFMEIAIAVDGVAPTSDHALDPAAPNGGNDWYISDVTVTLSADDGTEGWQSGVDDIKYKIDGGSEMTYTDPFVVSTDGEHTVTYWAVDNVGNKEADNTVDIDIDTTGPTIDLIWEAGSAMNEVIFTANCADTLSGMDIVEFYVNDVLQFTADTAPYTWSMVHGAGTKYTVKAIAYDAAGNTDFDEIGSGEGLNKHTPTPTTPTVQTTTPLIK